MHHHNSSSSHGRKKACIGKDSNNTASIKAITKREKIDDSGRIQISNPGLTFTSVSAAASVRRPAPRAPLCLSRCTGPVGVGAAAPVAGAVGLARFVHDGRHPIHMGWLWRFTSIEAQLIMIYGQNGDWEPQENKHEGWHDLEEASYQFR